MAETPTMLVIEAIASTRKLDPRTIAKMRALDRSNWAQWRRMYHKLLEASQELGLDLGNEVFREYIDCVAERHKLRTDVEVLPEFATGGIKRFNRCIRCETKRAAIRNEFSFKNKLGSYAYERNAEYKAMTKFLSIGEAGFVTDMEGWFDTIAYHARLVGVEVPANFHLLA